MRAPSCEDIVFWRVTGTKEDEDEVEALDGACSIATDMTICAAATQRRIGAAQLPRLAPRQTACRFGGGDQAIDSGDLWSRQWGWR
jgi:hypothetical protein